MTDQENWGPWIEHDGNPSPLPEGIWVDVKFRAPPEPYQFNPFNNGAFSQDIVWHWADENDDVLRYRTRKPLGLTMLEAIASDTTTPIVKVDA
ncbi:hypothetical protein phiGT1_61 [Sulfitobacter phage phiGT1]|nr:hypothetical protein phiGT1_61 [Sulfitobacter phage phiGT1]